MKKKLIAIITKYENEGERFLKASKDPLFRTKDERRMYFGFATSLSAITYDLRELVKEEEEKEMVIPVVPRDELEKNR